jgi:hypothetical protein
MSNPTGGLGYWAAVDASEPKTKKKKKGGDNNVRSVVGDS